MAQLLDVFGINSWIRLTDKVYTPSAPNITVDELVDGWRGAGGRTDDHLGKLEDVCAQLRIPFLITEVGVQTACVDGLAQQEGSTPPTGAPNHDVQALLVPLGPRCAAAIVVVHRGLDLAHACPLRLRRRLSRHPLRRREGAEDAIAKAPSLAAPAT